MRSIGVGAIKWRNYGDRAGCSSTLDSERLRVHGPAGRVLRDAAEVGVVLRTQVVDAQDGLIAADLADVDAGSGRGGGAPAAAAAARRQEDLVVAVPGQSHWEVSVSHRAEHRHALAEFQVLAHAELVQRRGD